ncbi:MAG: CopG family transcriptional regulator [Anaerolineae bacterium]|nr:CopG family transcriptional regulator [Anaerolineae bacterium]
MKRTTIMVDETLIYEIKQLAEQQNKSTASVIREALAQYVTEQHKLAPPENPLLGLVGLGASDEPTDVRDGGDEAILREGLDPVHGWSVTDDRSG